LLFSQRSEESDGERTRRAELTFSLPSWLPVLSRACVRCRSLKVGGILYICSRWMVGGWRIAWVLVVSESLPFFLVEPRLSSTSPSFSFSAFRKLTLFLSLSDFSIQLIDLTSTSSAAYMDDGAEAGLRGRYRRTILKLDSRTDSPSFPFPPLPFFRQARCPGFAPGSSKCSKCLRAGTECVLEQHKRGRKVGTR